MRGIVVNTRPEIDAKLLSERLNKNGFEIIEAPMLKIIFQNIDQARQQSMLHACKLGTLGVLFTSVNGVRAWEKNQKLSSFVSYARCCCVGSTTAKAARMAGFSRVDEALGDVEAMASLFSDHPEWKSFLWYHLRGVEQRGNLVQALQVLGFQSYALKAYTAQQILNFPDRLVLAIQEGQKISVVLYSPRTARFFEQVLVKLKLDTQNLTAYCMSKAVGQSLLLPWSDIRIAQQANSEVLEELLRHSEG